MLLIINSPPNQVILTKHLAIKHNIHSYLLNILHQSGVLIIHQQHMKASTTPLLILTHNLLFKRVRVLNYFLYVDLFSLCSGYACVAFELPLQHNIHQLSCVTLWKHLLISFVVFLRKEVLDFSDSMSCPCFEVGKRLKIIDHSIHSFLLYFTENFFVVVSVHHCEVTRGKASDCSSSINE